MTRNVEITYFDGEGRASMEECIRLAANWCVSNSITTMVIFTGTGEGPHYAAREFLLRERYKDLHVVAVTPPFGRLYKVNPSDPSSGYIRSGINPAMRDELEELGIRVVSAHLPFKEFQVGSSRTSEWTRVADAYGVLGGGFALCIQAVLMACDAGWVQHGERVVSVSADTALVATACRSELFLSPTVGLLVGHIICRPERYNISKNLHETIAPPNIAPPNLPAQPPLPQIAQTPAKVYDVLPPSSTPSVKSSIDAPKPGPKKSKVVARARVASNTKKATAKKMTAKTKSH